MGTCHRASVWQCGEEASLLVAFCLKLVLADAKWRFEFGSYMAFQPMGGHLFKVADLGWSSPILWCATLNMCLSVGQAVEHQRDQI